MNQNDFEKQKNEFRDQLIKSISPNLQGFSKIIQTISNGMETIKVLKNVADQTIGLLNGLDKQIPYHQKREEIEYFDDRRYNRPQQRKERPIKKVKKILAKIEGFETKVKITVPEFDLSASGSSERIAIEKICNKIENIHYIYEYDLVLEEIEHDRKTQENKSTQRA